MGGEPSGISACKMEMCPDPHNNVAPKYALSKVLVEVTGKCHVIPNTIDTEGQVIDVICKKI